MKKTLDILRKEFSRWSAPEIIRAAVSSLVILALSVYWGDDLIGIISALTGIWYVLLTGKGKRCAFIVGMINVLGYAYISMKAKFYGEVMLNIFYYIPMNIVGWIAWGRHMNADTGEVQRRRLSRRSGAVTYGLTLVGIVVYGFFLSKLGGNMPYTDSASTVISVTAMILTVRRMTEQWLLWLIVDLITVIMWGVSFSQGGESVATLAMWGIYLINAVIILVKWNKETKDR